MAVLGLCSSASTGCGENCTITGKGLFEAYKQAVLYPENFESWLAAHPNYFTDSRIACLEEKWDEAVQHEQDLLDQCDKNFSGDPQGLLMCREAIQSPEDFRTFWNAVVLSTSASVDFAETGVGEQMIFFKNEDPTDWLNTWNSIFAEFGDVMDRSLRCEHCKPWYDIF
jgi:hypothetical protein